MLIFLKNQLASNKARNKVKNKHKYKKNQAIVDKIMNFPREG